jgi:hypothetical protein
VRQREAARYDISGMGVYPGDVCIAPDGSIWVRSDSIGVDGDPFTRLEESLSMD